MLSLWNSDLLFTFAAMATMNLIGYWVLNKTMKRIRIWECFVDGEEFTNRDKWMIRNILCSLIHSFVSALWTTKW